MQLQNVKGDGKVRNFLRISLLLALFVVAVILGYVLLVRCPADQTCRNSAVLLENWSSILVFGTAVTLAVFGALVYMGYLADRSLSRGEMRRAIAGTFVIGLQMLLILSIVFDVYTEKVVTTYLTAMTMILGFYFGSRTAQQTQEVSRIEIENVSFAVKNDRKFISVSVRNLTPQEVSVDVVYIDGDPKNVNVKVLPGEVKHITLQFEWERKTYKVRVHTKEGYRAEVKATAGGDEYEA